jgi:hypothetical protein
MGVCLARFIANLQQIHYRRRTFPGTMSAFGDRERASFYGEFRILFSITGKYEATKYNEK